MDDNASQALLIAGGILLGILTLTMLVYMFYNLSVMGNAKQQEEETARLAAWNAEWESYDKRYLYGAEVLTVINKAEQNNIETDEKVTIKVKSDDTTIVQESFVKDYVKERKTNLFICESISYGDNTGRVNQMVFKFEE